jgi:hypothetical protein
LDVIICLDLDGCTLQEEEEWGEEEWEEEGGVPF